MAGSATQTFRVPRWHDAAARDVLSRAQDISRLGYVPYSGPVVSAPNAAEQASWQGAAQAAQAFGMMPQGADIMAGMPAPQTFAGGIQGYSAMPLYDQAVADWRERAPGQAAAYDRLFINPQTGQPGGPAGPGAPVPPVPGAPGGGKGPGGTVRPWEDINRFRDHMSPERWEALQRALAARQPPSQPGDSARRLNYGASRNPYSMGG